MANVFLSSDHHLSHAKLLTFVREDGTLLRTFAHIDEHDEYLIQQHNKVVRPQDKTYFLGDVTFHKKNLHLLARMNGEKILIKGNHDILPLAEYLPYFRDIRGCHQFDGMFLSHVPIHTESLGRWKINVHGHLHAGYVRLSNGTPDTRYVSVCMEKLDDYMPISLEQLKAKHL